MNQVSRRTMLKLTLPAILGPTSSLAQSIPSARATFVLVHGAFHGAWCWRKVVPLLRSRGHEVFTPTLTGLSERSHCATPDVDLDMHIRDVVSLLWFENLHDVVLVGHSYAGMVIAGAAHHADATGRLKHLVYLDAVYPEDGKALTDYSARPATRDDGWRVPPFGSPTATARFGVTDRADLAWLNERLTDQPIRTFTQPVNLSSRQGRAIPGTYIQIGRGRAYVEAAERARAAGYRHLDMPNAGHDAMVTSPTELSNILLSSV